MLVLLMSLLAACGGGGSDPVAPKALSELDFAKDPSLRLEVGSVGVTALEPKDAPSATSDDTGAPGTDEIPLHIAETKTLTYEMDPADKAIALIRLINLAGNKEVFALSAAQPRATVTLEPGDYQLIVHSGYTVAEANGAPHRVVFLRSNTATPAQSKVNVSSQSKKVAANYRPPDLICAFDPSDCPNCDLKHVLLHGLNLKLAILYGANLDKADLSDANLTQANLTKSTFKHSDLSGAIMSATNLEGANLTGAILTGANLSGADLSGANTTGAGFSGAVWTNGLLCAQGSITYCRQ